MVDYPRTKTRRGRRPESKPKLTWSAVRELPHDEKKYLKWDDTRGLAVEVQPRPSTRKTWKFNYSIRGRAGWCTIGDAVAMPPEDARKRANKLRVMVDDGLDPTAERRRGPDTFAGIHQRHLEEHAKLNNKSWKQGDHLIRTYVLPRWKDRRINAIAKKDVIELLGAVTKKPILRNQIHAAISAVFKWAMEVDVVAANPCRGIKKNPTRSRARVLSEEELPLCWAAFPPGVVGTALKVLLLTGQRPGEVRFMRREHIHGEWWEMKGPVISHLGWPGTKNKKDHRVWLPQQVRELIAELGTGFVFAKNARG